MHAIRQKINGQANYPSQRSSHLDGPAVGGEGEEGREGDGEEALDEEEVLASQGLRPVPRVVAHELLDRELEGDLLGLVEEQHPGLSAPGVERRLNEAVDVEEERRVADGGGGGEAGESEGVHALVV